MHMTAPEGFDAERAMEIIRARAQLSGAVPPSEEVMLEHAAEWDKAMRWMAPYEAVLAGMIRHHNDAFMEQIIQGDEPLTLDALTAHVVTLVKLGVHRLLTVGAIERNEVAEPRPLDILEQIFKLPPPPEAAP